MARERRSAEAPAMPARPWSAALAAMAALGRGDGGSGLAHLVRLAGFARAPAVTFVVKKAREPRPPAHELPSRFRDVPYADDTSVILPFEMLPLRALA